MKLMKQTRRRDYLFRHLYNFLPYLTFFKLINVLLNIFEKKYKLSKPISSPPYIKVEPTPLCQLRCPGCEQSADNYKKQFRNSMQISLEDFKSIIDPLSRTLLGISLSNHGEPLMHSNLSSLIKYAHNKNIAVSFPTNLSMKLSDESIEKLVQSGLDSMLVSLDGASEETYSKYRVGGNFSLILKNVKTIANTKKKYSLNRPKLIWKFVIFDHNAHEVNIVNDTYKALGFDDIEFVRDNKSAASLKNKQAYKANVRHSKTGCFWPWHAMIIRWDGKVFPCCTHKTFDLGNAIDNNPQEIWRSEKYMKLRNGFSDNKTKDKLNSVCSQCLGYNKRKNRQNKSSKKTDSIKVELA